MKGDSISMFAILIITVVSVTVLAFILWPRVQELGNARFQGCTPCDDVVKLEVVNYGTALVADQDIFEGVRLRLCNCRQEKVNLLDARIGYDVELPDGTTMSSKTYPLPKKGGAPMVPALEPQEGVRFDWYDMAPESDKVIAQGEDSKSGKVTVKLLVDGKKESDYVWQVFYSPICPGVCREWTGFWCYYPTEKEIGTLNCEKGERCCK